MVHVELRVTSCEVVQLVLQEDDTFADGATEVQERVKVLVSPTLDAMEAEREDDDNGPPGLEDSSDDESAIDLTQSDDEAAGVARYGARAAVGARHDAGRARRCARVLPDRICLSN